MVDFAFIYIKACLITTYENKFLLKIGMNFSITNYIINYAKLSVYDLFICSFI